jgi:hypothetical protein
VCGEFGVKSGRVNGEANVVALLSRYLSIKLGYRVRFDNLPEQVSF